MQQIEDERPLILEGAAYLPEIMAQHAVSSEQVLFMIPTYDFQVTHFRKRMWIQLFLQACDRPQQAFENWMLHDHLFGQEVLRQAKKLGYEIMIVDGQKSIAMQYEAVKKFLLPDRSD